MSNSTHVAYIVIVSGFVLAAASLYSSFGAMDFGLPALVIFVLAILYSALTAACIALWIIEAAGDDS